MNNYLKTINKLILFNKNIRNFSSIIPPNNNNNNDKEFFINYTMGLFTGLWIGTIINKKY
jgi:hypothetical protein